MTARPDTAAVAEGAVGTKPQRGEVNQKGQNQMTRENTDAIVRDIAEQLAASVAGLGFPVGLGVAPPQEMCMRAARGIAALYGAALSAAALHEGEGEDWSELLSWVDAMTKKHGNPIGTDYEQGVNDHGFRIRGHILMLIASARAALSRKQEPGVPTPGAWIEWSGGENPVAPDAVVQRKYRDGIIGKPLTNKEAMVAWTHYGSDNDIIAYRVVPTPGGEG